MASSRAPEPLWGTLVLGIYASYGVLGLVPQIERSPAYEAGLLVLLVLPLLAALVVALRRWHWRGSVP